MTREIAEVTFSTEYYTIIRKVWDDENDLFGEYRIEEIFPQTFETIGEAVYYAEMYAVPIWGRDNVRIVRLEEKENSDWGFIEYYSTDEEPEEWNRDVWNKNIIESARMARYERQQAKAEYLRKYGSWL